MHSLNIQIGYERGYRSLLCQELLPGTDVFCVDLYTAGLVRKKTHGSIIKLQALTSGSFKIRAQGDQKVEKKKQPDHIIFRFRKDEACGTSQVRLHCVCASEYSFCSNENL